MKKTAFWLSSFKRASVSTNMWSVQKTSTENCMSCFEIARSWYLQAEKESYEDRVLHRTI